MLARSPAAHDQYTKRSLNELARKVLTTHFTIEVHLILFRTKQRDRSAGERNTCNLQLQKIQIHVKTYLLRQEASLKTVGGIVECMTSMWTLQRLSNDLDMGIVQ
jgi:hypothetical protein